MRPARLLIANRGEIAIRIARAAADLGIATMGVYAEDDATCLHVRRVDEALALRGRGPRAYLDADALVAIAREAGCDAVHPGYGFLAERADFAQRCADARLVFVGPAPETLAILGDKALARALAERCDVPVLRGTDGGIDVEAARAFASRGPVIVKAVAGGGGRGMRVVATPAALDDAWSRCRSEAEAAFGNGAL